jgi:hypothetical protein
LNNIIISDDKCLNYKDLEWIERNINLPR